MPVVNNMVEYRTMIKSMAENHSLSVHEVESILALELGINENLLGERTRLVARNFVFDQANKKKWAFDVPAMAAKWKNKVKKPK